MGIEKDDTQGGKETLRQGRVASKAADVRG